MMKKVLAAGVLVAVACGGVAFAHENARRFFVEFMNGLQEAPAIVSTTGNGTFAASISRDGSRINYVLTFKELEGDVRMAHIHIGHPQNSGPVVLWLCDSEQNPSPSATTPACTEDDPSNLRAGKVTGTLTADDVQAAANNGIAGAPATTPGELDEVIALIRAGKTYVNLHTSTFGAGEIRSQIGDNDHRGHGAAR